MAGNGRQTTREGAERRGSGPRDTETGNRSSTVSNFLTLPYVDETVLCKVKKVVKKSKLNVHLGWYAPTTLKKALVSSALTKAPCPAGSRSCATCEAITEGRCTDKNVVYQVDCKLCGDSYIGESKRPVRLRFNEHVRSMLGATEYTPLGDHFRNKHPGINREKSMLGVQILRRTLDHPDRKITESLYIRDRKPKMNENMMSWPIL